MIERDVRFDIDGDQQRIHAIDTDIRDVRFKHILLPVWMVAYKFRGKNLSICRQWQNGARSGRTPVVSGQDRDCGDHRADSRSGHRVSGCPEPITPAAASPPQAGS